MKKYLVNLRINVADEGDVGLIKVLNEEQLEKANFVTTGFGNLEGLTTPFDKFTAVEITPEELKVLEKLGLTNLEFGRCSLNETEDPWEDDYGDDDMFDDMWDDEDWEEDASLI